jgi:UPF0755 protein
MLDTLPKRSERPTRRRGLLVLLSVVILMALVAGAIGGFYGWATGASGPQRKVVLLIPRGATGAQVADMLKNKGVIRSGFAFRVLARFRGFRHGFEAGKYTSLTTNMTIPNVLAALRKGPLVEEVSVGFPEGLTITGAAARASEVLGFSESAFVKAATSGRFSLSPYLPPGTKTVEGFMFPDTYDFLKDATTRDVIQRLLRQFRSVASREALQPRARALGYTPYEVVIVASLVEREARFPEDRPKIAAVIYNRLKKGMLLQVDATVEYALGRHKQKLTFADLKVKSLYNTYLHAGLPPTPIASPGLASLEAALAPAKADYLYYVVVDKAGHHYFTASYQDFLNHKNLPAG